MFSMPAMWELVPQTKRTRLSEQANSLLVYMSVCKLAALLISVMSPAKGYAQDVADWGGIWLPMPGQDWQKEGKEAGRRE